MQTPIRLYLVPVLLALATLFSATGCATTVPQDQAIAPRPNVILIITDDQGYGDIAAHGNSVIQTPNMDTLYSQCVRLTDFHVDPTCSPTRAALMTGRYSTRTGVWHTVLGRSLMDTNEVTLAEAFASNGYATAMFGKWHLGDNFPSRPQDQGFGEVFIHGGGGVGQTPDYWGNDYFDDTYFHNGTPVKTQGYCTDIWFRQATRFIDEHKDGDEPFFCYLSTNAPHSPYNISDEYADPYREHPATLNESMARFYGMITNIDDNLGELMAYLDEQGLSENTVLIFMTDNGTSAGWRPDAEGFTGYNAQMRGTKGSGWEGGHRVPFFVRWPAGGVQGGRDIAALSAHVDVMPTLVELCGLQMAQTPAWDGASFAQAVRGTGEAPTGRTLFVHSQRVEWPVKWRTPSIMTQRWRLMDENRLFDIQADPGQENNLYDQHPEIVAQLTAAYDAWWADLEAGFHDVPIVIGDDRANPTMLTAHDWHVEKGLPPWHQSHVAQDMVQNGYWIVEVAQAGTYRFTLRRRPTEAPAALNVSHAEVSVGDAWAQVDVDPTAESVAVEMELAAGEVRLSTQLGGDDDPDSDDPGAYYVQVERMD